MIILAPKHAWLFGALLCFAFGLLSIGLTEDWRLNHEDNGAAMTSRALSHIRLGLAATRAHDMFFNPHTGESGAYLHHPPLATLLLAGVFVLTGSDAPHVARMLPIAFQLGSLCLMVVLLGRFFPKPWALLGGFFMATLPMGAFFGRMVNYEALCLFGILLQLLGYVLYRQGHTAGTGLLCAGILLGGLIAWASFFFAGTIFCVEVIRALRSRPPALTAAAATGLTAGAVLMFDVWHLWYAGHGSLSALADVLTRNGGESQKIQIATFVFGQLDVFRRHFTHAGLISTGFVAFCLLFPNRPLSRRVFRGQEARVLKDLLLITGIAAAAYVCAAPSWAKNHLFWQFYFLPFATIAMVVVWSLVWENTPASPAWRVLAATFILDVLITSACVLHYRHTRVGEYAVWQTAEIRGNYLAPDHFTGLKTWTAR